MQIAAHKYKDLMLVDSRGMTRRLRNKIVRKRMNLDDQMASLDNYSIVICCNFAFNDSTKNVYSRKIKAICHPFRNDRMFPKKVKKYLLSESDFCDEMWVEAKDLDVPKKWDLTYFTLNSYQGARCKGFGALPLLDEIAGEMGIKVKVIDYTIVNKPKNEKRLKSYSKGSYKPILWYVRDRLPYLQNISMCNKNLNESQLNKIVQQSRCQFFPNTRDASPRMIPEALIRGTPVVVNQNIWGGWKYINKNNGAFFKFPLTLEEYKANRSTYKDDMKRAIDTALSKEYDPNKIKSDYYAKYGFKNTSNRLAKIVSSMHGLSDSRFKYAMYAPEFEKIGQELAKDVRSNPIGRKRVR